MAKGVVGDLALRNWFDIVLYCKQTVEESIETEGKMTLKVELPVFCFKLRGNFKLGSSRVHPKVISISYYN